MLEYKAVTPAYFLDELQPYEANLIIKHLDRTDRIEWEQTRLQVYTIASLFAKNKLAPTDVLRFPWDEDQQPDEQPTKEIFDALKTKAKTFENIMKNHDAQRNI